MERVMYTALVAEIWKKLIEMYGTRDLATRDHALCEISCVNSEDFRSLIDYAEHTKKHAKTLENMGNGLPQWQLSTFFRQGLEGHLKPHAFKIVQSARNQKVELSIDELTLALAVHVKRASLQEDSVRATATKSEQQNINQVYPTPIQNNEEENSSICTANTPPPTTTADFPDDHPSGSITPHSNLVPWPGSTFIIRSVSSGHVLTLLEGQITLTHPHSSRGSCHWACWENNGWLGFRNTVSGKFLGHDEEGKLRCTVEWHEKWEYFCFRMRPEGGCVLLMTHEDRLWHVGGIKVEQDGEEKVKLAKIGDGAAGGMVWEFVKV